MKNTPKVYLLLRVRGVTPAWSVTPLHVCRQLVIDAHAAPPVLWALRRLSWFRSAQALTVWLLRAPGSWGSEC